MTAIAFVIAATVALTTVANVLLLAPYLQTTTGAPPPTHVSQTEIAAWKPANDAGSQEAHRQVPEDQAVQRPTPQQLMADVEKTRKLLASADGPTSHDLLAQLRNRMRKHISDQPDANDETFDVAVKYGGLITAMLNKSCDDARSFANTSGRDPTVVPTERDIVKARRRTQYQLLFVSAYCD